MNPDPAAYSLCFRDFQEFYSEVLRFKQSLAPREQGTDLIPNGARAGEEGITPQYVNQKLLTVLQRQALEASRRGGEYGSIYYKEAQYIMAALGDEIFLHLNWPGQEEWKSLLLEYKLFGTHSAGELFFHKIDTLLSERDASFNEIALLYLSALGLGFQGKFRGSDDSEELKRYRQKLYAFVNHQDPRLDLTSKALFPEAYRHTLEEGTPRKLPYVKKWATILGLITLFFLVTSHILWINLSEELEVIVQKILTRGS